jgi:hypothetical protein
LVVKEVHSSLGAVGICWDMLGYVGLCWDMLGYVGMLCRTTMDHLLGKLPGLRKNRQVCASAAEHILCMCSAETDSSSDHEASGTVVSVDRGSQNGRYIL